MCDEPVTPGGGLVCSGCAGAFRPITEPRCLKCGKKLSREEEEFCKDCRDNPHYYEYGFCLYEYASVRESLYRFKYEGREEYAGFYARQMALFLKEEIAGMHPEAIVPVPLHRKRLRMRGYNQAEVLAVALGKFLGIPVKSDLVKRVKMTIPQKKLDNTARRNNVKNAFIITENIVKLNNVIVVDDIYTTGSTVDAVAKVLKKAGVSRVFFLTLAVGNGL